MAHISAPRSRNPSCNALVQENGPPRCAHEIWQFLFRETRKVGDTVAQFWGGTIQLSENAHVKSKPHQETIVVRSGSRPSALGKSSYNLIEK